MIDVRKNEGGTFSGDRPSFAATILVSALFVLGFQDALVKTISPDVSLWQFQLVRSLFNTILIIAVMLVSSSQIITFKPNRIGPVALRGFLQCAAMCFFFGAIPFLSLAEVAAGLYVFPLFVAILSVVILNEKVGPKRISAIFLGFIGTLLILKPGTDSFKFISVLPILAALCYAGSILTVRHLCREESSVTLALSVSLWLILIGGIMTALLTLIPLNNVDAQWAYLSSGWYVLGWSTVVLIMVCAVFNTFSNILLAKAYQLAEASWLAPFDYSYLIFATFWGWVFWNHIPDFFTLLGMFLIGCAGAFVSWREGQDHRFAHTPAKVRSE
ncbi:MAG: Riboflavin transporter [Alphaproteobacteria bacterium MarineAlpha3_Bin5]|nr:EamA family transporter [Magnetovibrio sp.]PPR76193.1 MAG: Riboflavin transporter [Alphaproteobacteria bacterium MarineAlpha3_Bin5]